MKTLFKNLSGQEIGIVITFIATVIMMFVSVAIAG